MTTKEVKTSVLASLTADVMGEKIAASKPTLTPVAGENRPPVMPQTKASFPNDIPQEVVEQQIKTLDHVIANLTEARNALAEVVQAPPTEKVVDLDAARKQKEFEADLRAKEKAAQEATFKPAEGEVLTDSAGGLEVEAAEPAGWKCPIHDKAGVEKTSTKTGKTFIGCPDCNLFQR